MQLTNWVNWLYCYFLLGFHFQRLLQYKSDKYLNSFNDDIVYGILGLCALLCYYYHRDMDDGNDLIDLSFCIKHIASILIFILFINLDESAYRWIESRFFFKPNDIKIAASQIWMHLYAFQTSRSVWVQRGHWTRCVADYILIEFRYSTSTLSVWSVSRKYKLLFHLRRWGVEEEHRGNCAMRLTVLSQ